MMPNAEIPAAWIRLAPGVYDDRRGGLHIVVPELLAGAGYMDTPENREQLLAAAADVFGPGLMVRE